MYYPKNAQSLNFCFGCEDKHLLNGPLSYNFLQILHSLPFAGQVPMCGYDPPQLKHFNEPCVLRHVVSLIASAKFLS